MREINVNGNGLFYRSIRSVKLENKLNIKYICLQLTINVENHMNKHTRVHKSSDKEQQSELPICTTPKKCG